MTPSIILKPHLSEKVYGLSETRNTYVFLVGPKFNSRQVAEEVGKQFKVGVKTVRMSASAAKPKRVYQKRGRFQTTTRVGFKKAYVTLNEGDKLPLFAAEEKADKQPAKTSTKLSPGETK